MASVEIQPSHPQTWCIAARQTEPSVPSALKKIWWQRRVEESYSRLLIRYLPLTSNTLYFPDTWTENLYWHWDRVKACGERELSKDLQVQISFWQALPKCLTLFLLFFQSLLHILCFQRGLKSVIKHWCAVKFRKCAVTYRKKKKLTITNLGMN